MGYHADGLSTGTGTGSSSLTLTIHGDTVDLPDASFVRDADMLREGMDLVLSGPDGTVIIENYFAAVPAPSLVAPDGSTLTPALVESFARSAAEFAQNATMTDESPVGSVQEVHGEAKVIHTDGTSDIITIGTPIYEGDIIETSADGAVNILFIDETSFAVSQDARLAIDDYVFDTDTQSGTTNFSVLKGVFVFTSGLIGRDDPDDVKIDTPIGSIGIRGTIIAGNVDSGEITVIEGAIVLRDLHGHEMTLANQFETAKFDLSGNDIQHMGELSAQDMSAKFSVIATVAPHLFSPINDAAQQAGSSESTGDDAAAQPGNEEQQGTTDGQDGSDAGAPDAPLPPPPVNGFGNNTGGFGDGLPPPPAGTAPGNLPPPPQGTGTTGTLPPPPPPGGTTGGEGSTLPAFKINVIQQNPVMEDSPGAMAAKVTGLNGIIANISINPNSLFADKFQIVQNASNPNVYDIKLKSGVSVDWDYLAAHNLLAQFGVALHATSIDGQVHNLFVKPPLTAVDEAPIHQADAPAVYFHGVEGSDWAYNFAQEFKNPDFGDTLSYQLSTTTVTQLNNMIADGTGGNTDILQSWNFNSATGLLTLSFAGDFVDTTAVQNFNIEIRATDGAGHSTSYANYTFSAYEPDIAYTGLLNSTDNKIMSDAGGTDSLIIGSGTTANNNTIFMLGGDDSVLISKGLGNTIHLGAGNNSVTLGYSGGTPNAVVGNTVIGDNGNDSFIMQSMANRLIGMGGDDDFVIDFTNGNISPLLNAGNADILIDGGHSAFRAAQVINPLLNPLHALEGTGGGRGDSLVLQGTGNIDFTAIDDNYIRGIERLNADNGQANTVTLNYNDVIQMTDGNNTLIINLDGNDTLVLDGSQFSLSEFQKVGDNVVLNDARNGETASNQNYDVYTNGEVTLLIHDASNGGANVTFDGTAVGI